MTEGEALTKRRDDDCDMVTSLISSEMPRNDLVLHEAARNNDKEILMKILARRATHVDCRNNLDRTALHLAASRGHVEIIELLLKVKATIELEDKYGMTPLMWAAYYKHTDVVELLVLKGATVLRRNKQGMNLLHIAAEVNCLELYEYIRKRHKRVKIDATDNHEMTPLLTAAAHNSVDVLKCLLRDHYCHTAVDNNKRSVWHHACKNSFNDILNELVDVEELKEIINDKDVDEMTALHYACEKGNSEGVFQLLSVKGIDLNITTHHNVTPLMVAARVGHADVVELLIKGGADVDAENDAGNCALHIAAGANQPEACRKLIEMNAKIDAINKRYQSPLHVSVEQNKCEAAEILLLYGADITLVDRAGKTALLLATRSGYIDMVDMIIKASRFRMKLKDAQDFHNELKHKNVQKAKIVCKDEENVEGEEDGERKKGDNHLQSMKEINESTVNIHMEEFLNRDYLHDGYRLLEYNHAYAEEFKIFLYKLATKHLRYGDWKKLGQFWRFQPHELFAIEHQQSGQQSYKQHSYRLLCIWFHSLEVHETPIRDLYEALVAIGRKKLAEKVRNDLNVGANALVQTKQRACVIS